MPLSGLLCESSLRWPAVFYVHAGITAVLTAGWWIVYRDIPNRHPQIGHAELRLIRKGKSAELDKHEENEPVSQMLLSYKIRA